MMDVMMPSGSCWWGNENVVIIEMTLHAQCPVPIGCAFKGTIIKCHL